MSETLRKKILNRLESMGQNPKKSLGQNFLVSDHIVDKIVEAADTVNFDQLIEIGPGLGSLTDSLLQKNIPYILIELDNTFAEYWQDEANAQVLHMDALKAPWGDLVKNKKTVLVSNLPYQISSRLVIDLSIAESSPQRMVLMFQKEVAKRILAQSGTPDYSLLTFISQVFWTPNLLLEAGAVDFYPKPNIASRVVVFDRKGYLSLEEQSKVLEFGKLCFEQKKKMLKKRLEGQFGEDRVKQAYKEMELSEGVRVGQLPPRALLALFTELTGISLDPLGKSH